MWIPDDETPFRNLMRKTAILEATSECIGSSFEGERSLLSWAAERDEEEVVQALADKGAPLDPDDASELTPLCWAASRGNTALVKLLLDKGAGLEQQSKSGMTPLLCAVLAKHHAIAEALLDANADPDASFNESQLPILAAVRLGDAKTAKLLLKHGADPGNNPSSSSYMIAQTWPLLAATICGYESIVEMLLDSQHLRKLPIAPGKDTPVDRAVASGNNNILRLLLQHGANPNTWEQCLFVALKNDDVAAVELLLKHGANPEIRNSDGLTPLRLAIRNCQKEMAQVLLANGADTEAEYATKSPLHEAVKAGNQPLTRLLLQYEHGGNIPLVLKLAVQMDSWTVVRLLAEKGAQTMCGNTPSVKLPVLSYVVSIGNAEVTVNMISKGANIHQVDQNGRTPLSYAASNGSVAIAQMLISQGANVKTPDSLGRTPLSYAAETPGNQAMVELLFKHGARACPRTLQGRSALSYAAMKGDLKMVSLLLTAVDMSGPGSGERGVHNLEHDTSSLAYAIQGGHIQIAELLLQGGVSATSGTWMGKTPFWYAVETRKADLVRILLRAGANAREMSPSGVSALRTAVEQGNFDLAVVLVAYEANVWEKDENGRALVSVAREGGHLELATVLQEEMDKQWKAWEENSGAHPQSL